MKLLLTGVLPWSVWIIAQRLARGGHDITVVGAAEAPAEKPAGVRHVPLDLEKKETTRYITAGGFDAVLFFFACQCEDPRDYGAVQGSQLDVMFDILHGSAKTSVRQFVLITDQRVFGAAQTPDEDEIPVPDTPTGIMIKAAESCVSCGVSGDIKTLIVRTTSLYAPGDPDSFFAQAALCAKNGQPWQLRGTADTPLRFSACRGFRRAAGACRQHGAGGRAPRAPGHPRHLRRDLRPDGKLSAGTEPGISGRGALRRRAAEPQRRRAGLGAPP